MGSRVRQELKIIPAQVTLGKHVRYIYACRDWEKEALNTPIITAPMPAPVLPGNLVSPSTMTYVMTGKYVDGCPVPVACRRNAGKIAGKANSIICPI